MPDSAKSLSHVLLVDLELSSGTYGRSLDTAAQSAYGIRKKACVTDR